MEIDYDLMAKCIKKSKYDLSKRKLVKKNGKQFIVDYNSKNVINAFNECVENSDDTTTNYSKNDLKTLLKGKKLNETMPNAINNTIKNATVSLLGGIILGKILRVNYLGMGGIGLALFLALSYKDYTNIQTSIRNMIKPK